MYVQFFFFNFAAQGSSNVTADQKFEESGAGTDTFVN